MYDHHVYDLIEIGVENFDPIISFGGGKKSSPQEGSKPCLVFIGQGFEEDEQLKHLKEIMIDVFRGEVRVLDKKNKDKKCRKRDNINFCNFVLGFVLGSGGN